MDGNQNPGGPSHALLHRVAEAIGLPIEAFYSDAPGEAGELLTLMRLWAAIEDRQARQRILMAARQEFERSGGDITASWPGRLPASRPSK